MRRIKNKLRNIYHRLRKYKASFKSWLFLNMPCFCKELYVNFHYLPFEQAKKLPIVLKNTAIYPNGNGEIIINSDKIYHGMILIGFDVRNNYWNTNRSILDIRGRLVIGGNVNFGPGSFIRVGKNALLEIGSNVGSSSGTNIYTYYKMSIGDGTKIGYDTSIMDTDSHPLYDEVRGKLTKIYSPVKIGKGCWIGTKSIILKGCKLADNTTVRAGSVVSGVFKEEKCIIGGNPAVLLDKGFYITEDSFASYPPITKKAY